MERMTTTRIKKETRPGIYRCDPTLYVRVYSETSKSFVQKLTLRKGRRIEIGLGGWPVVALDEAREIAFENRRAVRAGRNPLAEKRATERETVKPTFGVCASQWFEENRAAWKSDKTVVNTWSMIEAHALPLSGRHQWTRLPPRKLSSCSGRSTPSGQHRAEIAPAPECYFCMGGCARVLRHKSRWSLYQRSPAESEHGHDRTPRRNSAQ